MSRWGTLDARFVGPFPSLQESAVRHEMPTGSEDGPTVHAGAIEDRRHGFDYEVEASGRLRDVSDLDDSARVLSWFVRVCSRCYTHEAELRWSLDGGPLYHYTYTREGGLARVRGVLDL